MKNFNATFAFLLVTYIKYKHIVFLLICWLWQRSLRCWNTNPTKPHRARVLYAFLFLVAISENTQWFKPIADKINYCETITRASHPLKKVGTSRQNFMANTVHGNLFERYFVTQWRSKEGGLGAAGAWRHLFGGGTLLTNIYIWK